MSDPHLVLHKVRGAPAFDVAHRLQIGDEQGWISSTYGHRVYPYWWTPVIPTVFSCTEPPSMPDGWPDHFSVNPVAATEPATPRPKTKTKSVDSLLALIGDSLDTTTI